MQNRPANLLLSLKEVSKVKALSIEQVAEATTKNAFDLFPKSKCVK
jgi:Tat protein secretion system quality control protein TatD with DNase activity